MSDAIKQLIKKHYSQNEVLLPPDFPKREFMVYFFDKPTPKRYLAFKTKKDVQEYLVKNVPKHLYHSVCAFESPGDRKGWLYADLVMEFDLDKYYEKGKYHCPIGHSIDIMCNECYLFCNQEAMKLTDILLNDFGLQEQDINIAFSGHRGFHITLPSKEFQDMTPSERTSLVSYIMAENIDPKHIGFRPLLRKKKWVWEGPSIHKTGWRKRIVKATAAWLEGKNYTTFVEAGLTKKGAYLLSKIDNPSKHASLGDWATAFPSGLMPSDVYQIVRLACQQYRVELDTLVTHDIKRQFRTPLSVHGGSGLIVQPVKIKDIGDFNPFLMASMEKGDREIVLTKDIKQPIPMGEQNISGKTGDKILVNSGAALYLVCRGLASI